jgi:aspartyl-tRNA(Asn)/glutamyl-tRNA(Gln) amidotransferase subunit A
MIGPASGSVAPKFKSENVDKLSKRNLILENYLAIGNFGGFSSITIPCGFVNSMPIGLNITGPVREDLEVLNIAYSLECVYPYKGQIAKEGK